LDATRPPFLGAQAIVGRWLRDTAPARGAAKPPPNPPAHLDVDHMAVMVGKYKGSGILADLPAAESEAEDIVRAYQGIALPATPTALSQLLDAKLPLNFDTVGAGAVHFAGHGQFNPADPDSSVLFLSDGSPVSSMLFRAAQYGGDRQPFIFLNACMIGIGGELLGDMGGFPGNCLRGGFGAVLGALWAVDDAQASGIAREFWRRALPTDGSAPESVGAILRDFRQRYAVPPGGTCQSTYLAYTYYGHPRLLMRRKP
jgi:CHAT domain-containing protein